MKRDVRTLTGDALAWAVASLRWPGDTPVKDPSCWVRGGYPSIQHGDFLIKLMEEEAINLTWHGGYVRAEVPGSVEVTHPDIAIAVLRAYLLINVGETIDIPKEVLKP